MANTQRYGFTDIPIALLSSPPGTPWSTVATEQAALSTQLTPADPTKFLTSLNFSIIVGLKNADGSLTNQERILVTDPTTVPWTVVRSDPSLVHAVGEGIWDGTTANEVLNNPGGRTTTGDFDYLDSTGRLARLAAGADRTFVTYSGGVPIVRAIQSADLPDLSGTYATLSALSSGLAGKQNSITGLDTQVLFFDGANNPKGDDGFVYNKTAATATLGALVLGVADVVDRQGLVVTKTATAVDDFLLLNEFTYTYAPSADSGNSYAETFHAKAKTAVGNTRAVGALVGFSGETYAQGSGAVAFLYGNQSLVGGSGLTPTAHIGTAYNYYGILGAGGAGASIDAGYNFFADAIANFGTLGTITTAIQFYGAANGGQATNAYSFWSDEQGVFRIRADNTFNGVYQAIAALYNPQFTKYTPGAPNFERGVLGQWAGNVFQIGTEVGLGGGNVLRSVQIIGASLEVPATTTMGGAAVATQTYVNAQGFVTASSSTAFTNKSGNISQWTNDSSYTTLAAVAGVGYLTSVTAHNLLSATHGDTTAATAVRGDIITAQAVSPLWKRLAIGTVGKILQSDGTDVGWATPTGTGAPVLATSPALVTPTIGAASATSIAINSSVLIGGSSANIIEQRNAANAQKFYIYGTFTDANTYERLEIGYGVDQGNTWGIVPRKGSSGGTLRRIQIGAYNNNQTIDLYGGNAQSWVINSAGNVATLSPSADNSIDIGMASNRVRSLYLGTSIVSDTTGGFKIGTATTQKISLWNATPIVQPTTSVAAATFAANTSLIANDTATFDGYTVGQVVKALRNIGALA